MTTEMMRSVYRKIQGWPTIEYYTALIIYYLLIISLSFDFPLRVIVKSVQQNRNTSNI